MKYIKKFETIRLSDLDFPDKDKRRTNLEYRYKEGTWFIIKN